MIALLKTSVASSNNTHAQTHSVGRTLDQKCLKNQNSKKLSKSKNNLKFDSNNHVQNSSFGTLPCSTSPSDPYTESSTVPQPDTVPLSYTHTQSHPPTHTHTPADTGYTQGGPSANVQIARTVQRNNNFSLNALATVFVPNGGM
jgi:hypothetical protein